ncbi:MAG: hypothetical protein CMJ78_04000 [Planctomycetaceae bacterium]|nr:hypothetical protein [Planctomycetaceae bacterium]
MPSLIDFPLEETFAERMPGFYAACPPASVPEPSLLQFNYALADELGFETEPADSNTLAAILSGNELPESINPIAQAYAGHQFGGFVPQLGDGRAHLLGEVVDLNGQRRDIALKGSGRTPFSRGGDGKAAVGPVLREYIIGEAMHALGIPTTRALAAVATGETVMREGQLPGAVLTRVAASHIRVGTFEFFAARRRFDEVRQLADYVIDRHYPEHADEEDRYLSLFKAVIERQASLLSKWMLAGFIHGVMNTDNMTISGETIDYGPCAFMESYHPLTVFSSIDHGGRYAYRNQPIMAQWNLTRFAESLLPIIDDEPDLLVEKATEILNGFMPQFDKFWLTGVRAKLGLQDTEGDDEADRALAEEWLELLEQNDVDWTLAWRYLAAAVEENLEPLQSLFRSNEVLTPWLEKWNSRLCNPTAATATSMRNVNPIYIPRNHLVEDALTAASDDGDLNLFEKLLSVIEHPFDERPELEEYAKPAPSQFTACYKTFCGT